MRLAIFDLDNTLIAGDSDHGWGEFMVTQGLVDPVEYKRAHDQFYADYERGELDLQAYLNFSLAPLTRYSLAELDSLHQWLETAAEHGFTGDLTGCYFYSDSINDLPLMQVVDNPVAVDPDDKLRQHAQQHGWPVISLRD